MKLRLAVAALPVAIALAIIAFDTRGDSQWWKGHYIVMPEKASSPSDDGNGGADVFMTTNLPEGTRVGIEYGFTDPVTGGGGGSGSEVSHGRIHFAVSGDCLQPPERQSRGFTIKVVVRPGVRTGRLTVGTGTGTGHPQNVVDELGPNLERLKGAQVTTHEGMRALVATAEYEFPADKCQTVMDRYLLPAACGPSGTSPNDDEGGQNMQVVAGSVVVTLNQLRLCELYSYTTSRFKATNPWRTFRDRTKAWVDAHRPLERENFRYHMTPTITRMSEERIGGEFNSPAWIDVDYFLRGEKVGHARFVARLGTFQYTRWQIAELVLL